MKHLIIEWKHFDKNGKTCDRCSATQRLIKRTIRTMRQDSRYSDIRFTFRETKLFVHDLPDSNAVFINGKRLENLLSNVATTTSACQSCSELVGKPVDCLALDCGGVVSDSPPEEVIRLAIERAISS